MARLGSNAPHSKDPIPLVCPDQVNFDLARYMPQAEVFRITTVQLRGILTNGTKNREPLLKVGNLLR